MLRIVGVEIPMPDEKLNQSFAGIEFNPGAKIVIKPSFAMTLTELRTRFKKGNSISVNSTVVFEGNG